MNGSTEVQTGLVFDWKTVDVGPSVYIEWVVDRFKDTCEGQEKVIEIRSNDTQRAGEGEEEGAEH